MKDLQLQARVEALRRFYRERGRMPSFSELGALVGLRSKHAVSKLVARLEQEGVVYRDEQGRLIPGHLLSPFRLLGTVEAGLPAPEEAVEGEAVSLDTWLGGDRGFLLQVSGESMREAGILPGDYVLVDPERPARDGDIVVAEVDGDWTLKTLRRHQGRVWLEPAHPDYPEIHPRGQLRIGGVVVAVIRKLKG